MHILSPVSPRPPFEAASSVTASFFELAPRGSGLLSPIQALTRHAYATVSYPLAPLSRLLGEVLGTTEDLLEQRTLYGYCAIGMPPSGRERLRAKLLFGTGRATVWRLPSWLPEAGGAIRACPVCQPRTLQEFGVVALLSPHFGPFVEACWEDGMRLDECSLQTADMVRHDRIRLATPDAIDFARASFDLNRFGLRPDETRQSLADALDAAGYRHANGDFRAALFARDYLRFAVSHAPPSLATLLARSPSLITGVLRWIEHDERRLHPLFLVMLYWFLFGVRPDVQSAPIPNKVPAKHPSRQRGWGAKKRGGIGPCPVDQRHHFDRSNVRELLIRGCTCAETARLCRVSQATVHRYVRQHGLRSTVNRALEARCRAIVRKAWLAACRRHPTWSANHLARAEPRAQPWLRRHDAAWLANHRPPRSPRARGMPIERRAEAPRGREAVIVARISAALAGRAPSLADLDGLQSISIRKLCCALGMSEYAMQCAERWPRVRAAIARRGKTGR